MIKVFFRRTMMLRKVLITGASTYGVKNHGDDAMLATLVQSLQDIHGDLDITFTL